MATLLTIPRELRNQIILHILPERRSPPASHVQCNRWVHMPVSSFTNGVLLSNKSDVYTEPSLPENATSLALVPLTRTNRQLRDETREILRRLHYHLDIMHISTPNAQSTLMPTWISAPTYEKHIDSLYMSIRLLNGSQSAGAAHVVPPPLGDLYSYASPVDKSYLHLFQAYFQRGPAMHQSCRMDSEAAFSVRNLTLDIQQPEPGTRFDFDPATYSGWPSTWVSSEATPDGDLGMASSRHAFPTGGAAEVDLDNPAEHLAYSIWRWLGFMLAGKRNLSGRILYQGVRTIDIRVAGRLRKSVDVTEAFCRLPSDLGAEGFWPLNRFLHKWGFEAWRDGTIETRKRRGLWDEGAGERLLLAGDPECGLLIPGLWWALYDEDYRPGGHDMNEM
ncbi:hypothetical protein ACRALDRAFT_1062363 [Sodiomyces alcalophilus JCM 7366]|uniref:uncharacterized protein n=1 Tax=Sodiomyces alcalophilus JCM 7366 TaxID=591952 RepID=UPI0039B4CEE4